MVSVPITLANAIASDAALNATGVYAAHSADWLPSPHFTFLGGADFVGLAIWTVGMIMEAMADNAKLASYQHDTPRCVLTTP